MNNGIVLYGAGVHGRSVLGFLKQQGLDERVYAFVDGDSKKIGTIIDNKPVISYKDAKDKDLVIIVAVAGKCREEIVEKLNNDGMGFFNDIICWGQKELNLDPTELGRKFCAFYHISNMDKYFDEAESDESIEIFWGKSSPFYKRFQRLDLENVVELACGRGRHVDRYYQNAGRVTLVDILEKNISICRERFAGRSNIICYQNNGYDLSDLQDSSYTSLFTYDAMVHFEMFDVYNYLKETYRILRDGGMALFHHSNMSTSFDQSFENSGNPGGRNFMSKELFAYLSHKAGLKVIDQEVIDWSLPKMDCITLVKK